MPANTRPLSPCHKQGCGVDRTATGNQSYHAQASVGDDGHRWRVEHSHTRSLGVTTGVLPAVFACVCADRVDDAHGEHGPAADPADAGRGPRQHLHVRAAGRPGHPAPWHVVVLRHRPRRRAQPRLPVPGASRRLSSCDG